MTHKLVEIIWDDAHSNGHSETWVNIAEFMRSTDKPIQCKSVGYVVHECKETVAIVASLSFDDDDRIGQVSGTLVVPRGMIRSMKVLKKGGK